MQIINKSTKLQKLWENKEADFTELMKIVVDVSKEILAIDAQCMLILRNYYWMKVP